jgi:hypothetical protein
MTTKNKLDIAHMAGIVDAKVCFGIYGRARSSTGKRYFAPKIIILAVKSRLLRHMKAATGLGYIDSYMGKHINKRIYVWQILDLDGMESFIKTVRPYLKLKGKQADVMLDYIAVTRNKDVDPEITYEKKTMLYNRMKELKLDGRH